MDGAIVRDSHPAAPRTIDTAPLYDVGLWINRELPQVADVDLRAYLINERGRATQQIWSEARRTKALEGMQGSE